MGEDQKKIDLFENKPIPGAVMTLAIPTILSSLVMVFYNLADTYFVGMLNDAVQNAAVTLAAPVLLAFNAVNNLFGVGSSSMMSRALGRRDYEVVYKSSAFGFYCSIISGLLFSLFFTIFLDPLLVPAGNGCHNGGCHGRLPEMDGLLRRDAGHPERRHGVSGACGGLLHACEYRHHEPAACSTSCLTPSSFCPGG